MMILKEQEQIYSQQLQVLNNAPQPVMSQDPMVQELPYESPEQ